jgi:hypothetical protein
MGSHYLLIACPYIVSFQSGQRELVTAPAVVVTGRSRITAMKSDYIVAGILVGAMVVGLGAYSAHPGDEYCPSPSAASVATLFAPCQAFESAMGREVSKQDAVKMGLLTPDEQPFPTSQVAER